MSKRKPKVQPVEDTPQPMSDARLKHVREIMERGARVGIGLSHSLTQEVLNEIDRLRAEVAAKDAEIARLAKALEAGYDALVRGGWSHGDGTRAGDALNQMFTALSQAAAHRIRKATP